MSIKRLIEDPPSEAFFTGLHYTKVLNILGVSTGVKPGQMTRCVKCKQNTCLVSSLHPFNAWFYCNKCKLSGDAIRVYMQAYKLLDPVVALNTLKTEIKLVPALDPADLDKYVKFYNRYYNEIQGVWDLARRESTNLAVYGPTSRLYELGLWHNKDIFEKSFANWFGVLPKTTFEDMLKKDLPRGIRPLERVIVIPYYIKPGFISGFGVIGSKDIVTYVNVLDTHEGGFAGLCDLASTATTDVYCFTDVLAAARVKQKSVIEGCNYLPVISHAPVPTIDFCQVPVPVVLWSDVPTTELLKRCVAPRNFKVLLAETPYTWSPAEKKSKLWETKTIPEVYKAITGLTWHDPVAMFIKVLLDKPLAAAVALVGELSLTDYQQKVIMSACPDDSRAELLKLLNKAVTVDPIVLNKKTYYQKDGKWWVSGSRDIGDEIVSDVVMSISHVCRVSGTAKAVVFGKLNFEGKEVDFTADEDDMELSGRKAIYEILASAGITEQPFIADSIKKSVFSIALLFKTPEVLMVQDYVGFNEAQNRFNLPNMAVDPTTIKVGMPFVLSDETTPCDNVVLEAGLEMGSITRLFQNTAETAAYWASMAAIIANINNNITKARNSNVLFVGGKGSLAQHVFDVIRYDLGLISPRIKSSKSLTDAVHLPAQLHHVPVALDGLAMSPRTLAKWLEGEGYNSIVLAPSINAAALGHDKDWTFIRADIPVTGESLALLRSEFVFPFMLQMLLTTRPSTATVFLEHLTYVGRSLGADTTVLQRARSMVSEGGAIKTKSPSVQLINLLQLGVASGVFKVLNAGKFQKTYTILNDPFKQTVSLNVSNFIGQLRYHELPIANWDAAFDELKSSGMVQSTDQDKTILTGSKDMWLQLNKKVLRIRASYKEFLRDLTTK